MLELKVRSVGKLSVLFSGEFLNFEDEIFLRVVECNIPLNFHQIAESVECVKERYL